jgi:hypothetical protein
VCGSFAFNIPPSFGLPLKHLPSPLREPDSNNFLMGKRSSGISIFAPDFNAVKMFSDLHAMSSVIQGGVPKIWQDPTFLGLYVNPLALRLLLMGRETESFGSSPTSRLEACRLAGLLYLSRVC